jgi:DNA polymerase III sliding clamp (beta) subunit (PCNA family)
MIFSVSKRDLETALKVVKSTVSMGGSDISSHYLFRQTEAGSKSLEILSYDGRVFASCPVVASFEEEGKPFTVEAKRVHALLEAVADDAVLKVSSVGVGEVTISAGRGKNTFASLDPDLFPYWDEVLGLSTRTATLPADRLNEALTHAKAFIYDQESKAPQLCVAEFRKGCLYSTDQMAMSVVKVSGMEESAIRIYGKDCGSIVSFLATFKDSPVEIWEEDRAMFLKRADGAVLGESRNANRFPDIAVDWTIEDDHWIDLPKVEVANAVKFLAAGAKWEETKIKMIVGDGNVTLLMDAANGKPISLEVKAIGQGFKSVDAPSLPKDGFPISKIYVLNLLEHHSGETIRFGISKKGKGGWIRVKDERGPDTYLTTVAWLKAS